MRLHKKTQILMVEEIIKQAEVMGQAKAILANLEEGEISSKLQAERIVRECDESIKKAKNVLYDSLI